MAQNQVMRQVCFIGASEFKLEVTFTGRNHDLTARKETPSGQQAGFVFSGNAVNPILWNRNHRFHASQKDLIEKKNAVCGDANKTSAATFHIQHGFHFFTGQHCRFNFVILFFTIKGYLVHAHLL
jgi:hypothetical protein